MKVKLSKQQIEAILADPEKAQEAGVKTNGRSQREAAPAFSNNRL